MKLLIANRGEIAARIIRTAKKLQVPTLILYTKTDETTLPVFTADESVLVESYLDQEAIIAIAVAHKVTLIHPGYGFLSENAEFAFKIENAGIFWLGPESSTIKSLGLKHEARQLAAASGVPIIPASSIVNSVEEAIISAGEIGYPIMIKASAGGGGMCIIRCDGEENLKMEFPKIISQALSLFSNGQVFIEKFIEKGKHLEIQIMGDGQGKVVSYGIRDCSTQRRNQKVIEESVDHARSTNFIEMEKCAIRLCESINYRSAGTVEFIVDESGNFYFLEVNCRIQVEHAVTEMVRPGLDLIELMLELGLSSSNVPFDLPLFEQSGHSIEARIYAETPHLNFKPSPGSLQHVSFPAQEWLRIETWVETGTFISPLYDPVIAKIIVSGGTREEARIRLLSVLDSTKIQGVQTNLNYISAILESHEFKDGKVWTTFLNSFEFTANCLEIIDGGLGNSIQDSGRNTSGDGIPQGGYLDSLAARAANLLAGNPIETELIEILSGLTISFTQKTMVGIAGAGCEIAIDDVPLVDSNWSRLTLPAGSILEIVNCQGGVYLAIHGELEIPRYMGSKSTFPGVFGGHQGRNLITGDVINIIPTESKSLPDFTLPKSLQIQHYSRSWKLAVIPGPHADTNYLTKDDLATFFSSILTASLDSNRSGIRLDGLPKLKFSRKDGEAGGGHSSNVLDHGYTVGMLNMNGDTPVLFGADSPDAGGFVCPLTVVSCDFWKMGRIQPGDSITFVETTLDLVQNQRDEQARWISNVQESIQNRNRVLEYLSLQEVHLEMVEAKSDGVLLFVEADVVNAQPALSYRLVADCAILVEIGPQILSFTIRVFSEQWERRFRSLNVLGFSSLIQGSASILVRFDSNITNSATILSHLVSTSKGASLSESIKSRKVFLPMVFDDSQSRASIAHYMKTTGRERSVYLPSNIEYFQKVIEKDVLETFSSSLWYVSARAFFCGLPFLLPIDQRASLAAQKYNPSRTSTPSGAIGFAGSTAAIYPIESPGGYMLLGRTLSPWKLYSDTYEGHFLLRSFDVISWLPMPEEEFNLVEAAFKAGKYQVKIEDCQISPLEILELERSTGLEVKNNIALQRKNMARLAEEEEIYLAEWMEEKGKKKIVETANLSTDYSGIPLKAPVHSIMRSIDVVIGDLLKVDGVLATFEAMKTQISFKVPRKCIGKTITAVAVNVGDTLVPGQALFYCN